MLAVGGSCAASGHFAAQSEFVHPAADPLGVDRPAETFHHLGEATVTKSRPLGGQVEQCRLEHGFVDGGTRPVVDGTARDAEQPTEQTNRKVIGEAQDNLPFFVEGPLSSRDAFFRTSSS